MDPLRFGVIGAASFVANAAVLPAIVASAKTNLTAAASVGGAVDPRFSDVEVATYEDVVDHPDVDAVYIPLPNHLHMEWIERCASAGKHVLCEKPMALSASDASRAATACRDAGVFLAEAWMTPFHKRWQLAMLHASGGQLGSPTNVDTKFTFTIEPGNETNYRFDPSMGGGAFNDVGIYCLGPAIKLWGPAAEVVEVESSGSDGIDLTTEFTVRWAEGQTATGRCSFVEDEQQSLDVTCERGSISVATQAHTGGDETPTFSWSSDDGDHTVPCRANDPYHTMIERFADAVSGERDWPRTMEETIAVTALMDRIRAEL